jgi:hypothetical protein
VDESEAFKGLTDEAARIYLDTGELLQILQQNNGLCDEGVVYTIRAGQCEGVQKLYDSRWIRCSATEMAASRLVADSDARTILTATVRL